MFLSLVLCELDGERLLSISLYFYKFYAECIRHEMGHEIIGYREVIRHNQGTLFLPLSVAEKQTSIQTIPTLSLHKVSDCRHFLFFLWEHAFFNNMLHRQIFLFANLLSIELPAVLLGGHFSPILHVRKWRQGQWSDLFEGTQLVNKLIGLGINPRGVCLQVLNIPKPTFRRPLWDCHCNCSLGAVAGPCGKQGYRSKPSN